jgi:lipoprotein-releasing system permease protein
MGFFEFFIGFRYLKSKKSQSFISFNTLLSMIIVFLGVFILIVVISVMNGFQSQIKDKILDVNAHITLEHKKKKPIYNYKKVVASVIKHSDVISADPYIQGQALFRYGGNIVPAMIMGIGTPEQKPTNVTKFLMSGKKLYTKKRGIYVGSQMRTQLFWYNVKWVDLIVPKGNISAKMGMTPGIGKFPVLGHFKTGYYEYDTSLVIMSLKDAQNLFALGNVSMGIAVKVKDVWNLDAIKKKMAETYGADFDITTAKDKNQNLFHALQLEKLIMTIILFLVIISAGFTIMGTLVMVVMEKRKAIGILKSMGARPNAIMTIFVLEGFLIGLIGTITGVVLGLATTLNLEAIVKWIEKTINDGGAWLYSSWLFNKIGIVGFNAVKLVPDNVYYIDTIPTRVEPEFVVLISVIAVFIATVAAIFPSWQASRQKPVDTIRFE